MKHISLRIAAALTVFALCVPLFSQSTAQPQAEQTVSAADITLSTDESTITFDPATPDASFSATADSPSAVGLFVRMIVALLVVAALIYVVARFFKRGMQPGAENDPFLRKVSQITLRPGKSVQIVTLFNHAYLVGVTDNAINLIGEITDPELVDSMNLYADQNANETKPRTFADILNIFMPNAARAATEPAEEQTAQTAAEHLQRQRERLNGADGGAE